MPRTIRLFGMSALVLVCFSTAIFSQGDAAPPADAAPPEQSAAGEPAPAEAAGGPVLGQRQQQIQRDFERFEESLYKLSEVMRSADPDLADLLARARGQSREQRILQQMKALSDLLSEGNELGEAVGRQEEVITNLQVLLKLLQSEDERDRLAREIARYEDLLKDTNRIIGAQKDVRADTERRGDPGKLEGDQKGVTDKAQGLATLRLAVERVPEHAQAREAVERLLSEEALFDDAFDTLEGVYRSTHRGEELARLYERRVDRADGTRARTRALVSPTCASADGARPLVGTMSPWNEVISTTGVPAVAVLK